MSIRYPAPLRPGDRIGVTAPSSGVPAELSRRLDFCVGFLRARGYEVVLGSCLDGGGVTSAPADARAAELSDMLLDPAIAAVVPPWGGDLAIDLLPLLDFEAFAAAKPTWLMGYSDITTVMLPLTVLTGLATLHAGNLMDTPYTPPEPLAHWLDAATLAPDGELRQGASPAFLGGAWDDYAEHPDVSEWTLRESARWKLLGEQRDVRVTGRVLGGCLETVSMLAGSAYGDVPGFATRHAPEGLLVYVEVAEADALTAARMLHGLRLAGWFDAANAVLVGRPAGRASPGFTQVDALKHALGGLDLPVLYDLDIGHVPPQLAVVNGSLATVELTASSATLVQQLS